MKLKMSNFGIWAVQKTGRFLIKIGHLQLPSRYYVPPSTGQGAVYSNFCPVAFNVCSVDFEGI